jgi:hypothetical protein
MNVSGQAEEQRIEEEIVASSPAETPRATVAPGPDPVAAIPADVAVRSDVPGLNRAWLRLAYTVEFWIAAIAILTIWSEVGGQGHLDMLPWYVKLAGTVTLAWSSVRMTAAGVESPGRAWNRRTLRWFFAVLAITTAMAGITYWYHLHEVLDQPDTDENTATSVSSRRPGGLSAMLTLSELSKNT